MDSAYFHKKIVDLSDAELIALGFQGEDAAPGIKRIVDMVRAHPENLGTMTCYMVDCVRRKYQIKARPQVATKPPASSTSPVLSEDQPPHPELRNDSNARTVVAPDVISEYERNCWYRGISGDPPKLMWRSDLATNPFPVRPPGARFFTIPTKTAHGVFNTPLNDVWDDTVAPRILASIKAHGIKYSALKTARFSSVEYGEDGELEAFGPVVVWIAVRPNTTTAGAVRDATPDILRILADAQITDVVVEWYEGSVVRLVGPPLRSVELDTRPEFGLDHPFNTGLGIPVARQSDDAEGTLTLLFKEMKTRSGEPSERILALTSKHVASVDTTTDYELDGANPQHILVCGKGRVDRAFADLKQAIKDMTLETNNLYKGIEKLQARWDASTENVAEAVRSKQSDKDKLASKISTLQTFFDKVKADWQDANSRRLGVVDWAPKISVSVDDRHYTRDIATFAVDREKLENFERNTIDLGNQYTVSELEDLFWPLAAFWEDRKLPIDLQLPVRCVLPFKQVITPDTKDRYGEPLYIVGKYGNATKLTLGRYSGMDAYICTDLGLESREVAVYNHGTYSGGFPDHGDSDFSDHGDSGSLIFTGDGDALAILHSGMPRGTDNDNHVTFGTPMWWVVKQILVKYPFAEFYGITHSLD
ncbi:hypothetical protein FA95DRAFT_1681056 [Auriscalpium vulgare]|uniref:Uncharacterized protein n=1 Tax=Auriscalpium vulgare TaxID=40419 RepID=A0ACB8RKA6_9AGAM|nr:hypothetical protein FA95DRAFT_1681056 [Auriscalpium vulgare]